MESPPEEGRGFRQRKKQIEPYCCPVCGITIRSSEIEQHYNLEIDRLVKLQANNSKSKKPITNGTTYHDPLPGCSSNGNSDSSSGCPWIQFQKIRNNRFSRLKIKPRKRKPEEPICPVCNEHPNEDINIHVEKCLRKSENANKSNGDSTNNTSDDESIDIGDSFEEYEWAGQKRIRASSLLEGGYSAAGVGTTINANNSNDNDEDEDLIVDDDDTQIYGPPQYTERDVIVSYNDECDNENRLRRLVTGQDITTESLTTTGIMTTTTSTAITTNIDNLVSSNNYNSPYQSSIESDTGIYNKTINLDENINSNSSHNNNNNNNNSNTNSNSSHIIESLKTKIREYESQISNKYKCLICMDEFRHPTVSICCWHVHCEECWLRTLGARRLCPQCNMITSPSDLRRIYM